MNDMNALVIGTAGHIDHGKTALVKALTGIDTDRLAEEKARGITIELGFASLELEPGLSAGIVDVPGHERFVKTMVAGTAGIDLVMMVVAADEGVMPQTREHLDVCRLLGVKRGLVVLNKIDLVDDSEWLQLLRQELEREFAGTFLAGAPVVEVSAHTGQGIAELREQLVKLAHMVTRHRERAPAFLPIDRSFSIHGFGTVVTGTLLSGTFTSGQTVDVLPDPERRRRGLKVRGIQVHGRDRQQAQAGERTALNLAAVESQQLGRGQVVVASGTLEAGRVFEAELELVSGARPLQQQLHCTFHAGTANSRARVRLLDRPRLEPGERALVRITCEQPLAALPGQHYLLRGFTRIAARGTTLGGGRLLTIMPPRRRARDIEQTLAELRVLRDGSPEQRLLAVLGQFGPRAVDNSSLAMRLGYSGDYTAELLQRLADQGQVVVLDPTTGRALAQADLEHLLQQALEALRRFHRRQPLLPGMASEQLRTSFRPPLEPKLFKALVELGLRRGQLRQQQQIVSLADHRVELDERRTRLAEQVGAIYRRAGCLMPRLKQVAEQLGQDPALVQELARHLERQGVLVNIGSDLYVDAQALGELRRKLQQFLESAGQITTQQFKEMVGGSRKHVIPLAEYFDGEKLTVRKGEVRVLRRR